MADLGMMCINCGCTVSHVGKTCHVCRKCNNFMRPDVFMCMQLSMLNQQIQSLTQFVQGSQLTLIELMGEAYPTARGILEKRREEERAEREKLEAEARAAALAEVDEALNTATEGEVVLGNFTATDGPDDADESALD